MHSSGGGVNICLTALYLYLLLLVHVFFIQRNFFFQVINISPMRLLLACPQSVRKRYIAETCRTKNLTKRSRPSPPASLIIDHRHKLVYCLVPKAASRTIRSVIGSALTGNDSYNPDHDFSRLQDISVYSRLPAKVQKEVIADYKKLIVVRHPYSR